MEEKVMNLMRRGVITCSEETTLQEVAQIMVANSIRYCVVTNQNNEVKGLISARLMLKGYKKNLEQGRAKDILMPYTITITPNSSLKEAVGVMSQKRIEHLIVVSDRPGSKAILGLVHAEDIISKMARD
ncbi:MAG: CBS domain-containing protein [Desulfobaccales bacterium]